MQYPLISEYLAAIRDAHDNLDKLSHLVPVMDKYGEPYRSSGAFAVVFKMKDEQTGKCYALKCFTEEQEGRAEAYRKIAEELEFVDSPYITSVKYLEKELFVDSNCENEEFPVLLMDWIEGETMETYIAANYTDTHAMAMLCYRFCILRVGIFFLVHQFRQISNVILTGKLRLSPKQHALWTPVGIPVPVRELHLFHTDQILCEPRLRRDVIFKPNPGNSGKRDDQAQHCPQSNADILQPLPFPGSSPLVPYFPVQPDGYSQIYIKQEKQQTQQIPQ